MKIYRLENALGEGPFANNQECSKHLAYHYDPEDLIRVMNLPDQFLKTLSENNFVFGWLHKKDALGFVKKGQLKNCKQLGFDIVEYNTQWYFSLIDGQVMFAKEPPPLEIVSQILKALSATKRTVSKSEVVQARFKIG